MLNLQKILGRNIKYQRSLKELSQGELTEKSGIGQGRLSRIEDGQIDIGIQTIEKIAEGLRVSPSELLIDTSKKESSITDKLIQIQSLNDYDQKLIEAMLETFIEKNRLENKQNVKMKGRLDELNKMRRE